MIMDDYFYNGELMKCYEMAKLVVDGPEKALADKYIALLEEYDFAKYPKPTLIVEVQHAERADESYPESDAVVAIRAIKDEAAFAQHVKELEEIAKTGTASEKAQSFFYPG